jgi:hypothetical protein
MAHILSSDGWQQHIEAFQSCNQTKMAYCKAHELNYHQFLYWHKKLSIRASSLVPVIVEDQHVHADTLATLYLNSGHKLSIHSTRALEMILSVRL